MNLLFNHMDKVMDGIEARQRHRYAKVIVQQVNPPVPTRRWDYAAHIDGQEESALVGHGATEVDALRDLAEQLADNANKRVALAIEKALGLALGKKD